MSSFSQYATEHPKTKEEAIERLQGYKKALAHYGSIPSIIPPAFRDGFLKHLRDLQAQIDYAINRLQNNNRFWVSNRSKLQEISGLAYDMQYTADQFRTLSEHSREIFIRNNPRLNHMANNPPQHHASITVPVASAYTMLMPAPNSNNPITPTGPAAAATLHPNRPVAANYGSTSIPMAATSTLALPTDNSAVAANSGAVSRSAVAVNSAAAFYSNRDTGFTRTVNGAIDQGLQHQRWVTARSTPNLNYHNDANANLNQQAGPSRPAPPPVPQLPSTGENSRQWNTYYYGRESFNADDGESTVSYGSSDNSASGLIKRTS